MSEAIDRDIIWLPKGRVSAKQIIHHVAERRGLTVAQMLSPDRTERIAHARQEAMWEIRQRTPMSLADIGRRMGGRHHTTVLHAVRTHERRMREGEA